MKKYRELTKKEKNEYQRKWYKNNPIKVKGYQKKKWLNPIYREKRLKKIKEYRRNNPEKIKQWRKTRYLRLRFQILQKYHFTCQYCGRKAPEVVLEIDHKYPKSKGGLNNIKNYTVACKDCNLGKNDSILS